MLSKIFCRNSSKYSSMKNEKFGIGISIDYDKETGLTYVSKVHSPDLKDIVERNDIIIEINDAEVVLNSTFEIRDMIVGEYDSTVKIKFYRNKDEYSHTFSRNFTSSIFE